ncbi:TetR family transcriptional regulator [Nocardia sp. NBC_01009]|uniref:TetR family transcriptional regulator n=1 Tax=Nocardia sp. NBC_01009 TaxID=2975996 RepID=UPI00386DA69A|nr:TetR family transcriptional regulator [Nocardia sp. NBC_01009]
MTDDTRARILRAALDMFAARGYHAVTVREIAQHLGLTKTAVLYHFPSKSDIIPALAEPLLTEMDAVLTTAGGQSDPESARWAVVVGLLDLWLSHGLLLQMHMRDQALSAHVATFGRLRDAALRAQELIAGADADLAARVNAAQVYAALSDPVVIFADRPTAELRAAILEGARRLLGMAVPQGISTDSPVVAATPQSSSDRRNLRGRPGTMSAAMVESARQMRAAGAYTVDGIAAELGVSRATLYRHLSVRGESHAPGE